MVSGASGVGGQRERGSKWGVEKWREMAELFRVLGCNREGLFLSKRAALAVSLGTRLRAMQTPQGT